MSQDIVPTKRGGPWASSATSSKQSSETAAVTVTWREAPASPRRGSPSSKKYLAKQAPANSLPVLQLQLDSFRAEYNHHRPHRALYGVTPLVAFNARLRAHPAAPEPAIHCRVRQDRVCLEGKVTLRYVNRLLHIGVGRAFKHQPIRLLVADRHVRILTEDGVLIRELTIDLTRNYQAQQPAQIGHYHLRQTGTMS